MDPKDSLEDILSELKAEYRPKCTPQDPLKGNSSSIHHELLIPDQLDALQPDVAYRDPGLNALLKDIKNDPRDLTLGHSKNQKHLSENHGYQDLLHKELFDYPKDKIKTPSGDQKVRVPQSPTSLDPKLKALLQDLTTEELSAKHLPQSATPALPSDPKLKALLQDLTIQESSPPKNPPRRQDPLKQEKKRGSSGFMVTAQQVPNINPGDGKDLRDLSALNAATPPRFQESQKRSHQTPETNLFPAQENVNSTSDKPYQDDIQQKRIWIKKAQSWLKSLNPDSFDAEWFAVYAQSYPSRLEAAISYLQGIAELEGNHG